MKARLFFLITSIPLVGCHFGGGFTHIAPSIGSKTSPPNEEFMYLDLNESYYDNLGIEPPLYELNTTEESGDSERRDSVSNCEIFYDEEEPSAPELICILDYMEEEFLTYNLSFVLNIPKGMCSHLHSMPSWHYNRPAGYGPLTICHYSKKEEEEDDEDFYYDWTGRTEKECKELTAPPTNDCSKSEEDLIEGCCGDYHHVVGKDTEINCCLGDYTLYGESAEENSWGGEALNCLGGPGRTNWDSRDKNGFPVFLSEYILEDGLRRIYEINSLLTTSSSTGYSTPIANYMEDLNKPLDEIQEDDSLGEDLVDLDFIRPEPVYTNRYLDDARPFYSFTCTDSAGEILHRIRLMIREWNTHEEFMSYYDSRGDDESANPDVEGEEGDDCLYENRRLFGSITNFSGCNDYLDMDDIINDDDRRDKYPRAPYE